jgi:hypothetical protein
MKRVLLLLTLLLIAASAGAATPFFLDRNGVLWKASGDNNGLHMTGEVEGTVVAAAVVPFPYGAPGTSDTEIQVAADEQTGKVTVVWQRNWAASVSDIMLAVWQNGQWEKVQRLSQDSSANPRFPVVQIAQVASSAPDPANPDDPSLATTVQDSFLEVVWWEGGGNAQHGTIAIWQLTADSPDDALAFQGSLDRFVFQGVSCNTPAPPEALEHPQFATQSTRAESLLFFGAQHTCLFYLLGIGYQLDTPSVATDGGITVVAQRRRNVPVFGVKKAFPMNQEFQMESARVVLGTDLNPVAYRVIGPTVEYTSYSQNGWSPRRTLTMKDGMTMDQAIPLVENLVR